MWKNCVHFEASDKPLGKEISVKKKSGGVCPVKSAGHSRHEYTTGYAHDEIFKLFGYL
jgi:hypothetical protein